MSINTFGTTVETKDWIDRVQSNGGTLTTTEIRAGEYFIQAAIDGGWYGKILRAWLYPSDLEAALVPLICTKGRSPFRNAGSFVQADLTANGLKGNGSSKYLHTDLSLANLGAADNVTMSLYLTELVSETKYLAGTFDGTNVFALSDTPTVYTGRAFDFTDGEGTASVSKAVGTLSVRRTAANDMTTRINETESNAIAGSGGSLPSTTIVLHGNNDNGTPATFTAVRIGGGLIGFGMTDTEAAHYHQTMNYVQQTVLGRPSV